MAKSISGDHEGILEDIARHARMGRREFLTRSGRIAASVGAGMAFAGSAFGQGEEAETAEAPELDPIRIGMIGVGGMGYGHLTDLMQREANGAAVQVLAVSDVYERRKLRAQACVRDAVGREVEAYTDYRDLLARDDIDGVIIATPDHWHALNAIDAMKAGKDVYCQKPVTLTCEEAIAVRDCVAETGRVFQCGAQRSSEDWVWKVRDFVARGGIGKIVWVQADYSRNSGNKDNPQGGEWNYTIDEDATDDPAGGEAYIDWPQWLGPAPKRPFSKPRFFQFRKYWDYSGGIATDLMYHVLAPLTIALDIHAPERVTAAGGIFVQKDDREVPDTFMALLDYPEDLTIVLTSSMANAQGNPLVIRGHRGTIRLEGDKAVATAEREFADWFVEEHGAEQVVLEPEPRAEHVTNWLDCIRSRGVCHLDAATACDAMVGIRLAVEAYREDQVVYWDAKEERRVASHPRPDRDSFVPRIAS